MTTTPFASKEVPSDMNCALDNSITAKKERKRQQGLGNEHRCKNVAFYISVTPVRHMIWNVGAAQALDDSYQDLTNDISLDWKKLGRQLGFSNAHLNNFDHENHYVDRKSVV